MSGLAKVVAVWAVAPDGKLYRPAWQVFCPTCGYLSPKVAYQAAENRRKRHLCPS
jgi:adenine-specific DNA methylase